MTCQNCGHANTDGSNFCRFCGIKFAPLQSAPPVQQPPAFGQGIPRPYSWKTDEFNISKPTSARKTGMIDRVKPLADFQSSTSPINGQTQNYGIQQQQRFGQNAMITGYRCPRCSTQLLPQVTKKISSAGWIVFAVLLVAFFPLFWLGFFIKEEVSICPVCNVQLQK